MKSFRTTALVDLTPARLEVYQVKGYTVADIGTKIEAQVRVKYKLIKHDDMGRLLGSSEWLLEKGYVDEILPNGYDIPLVVFSDEFYHRYWDEILEIERELK